MLELLRAGAERSPDQPLVVCSRGTFTYGDVLADGQRIAAGLRERGLTRVGAVVRDAEQVIALLAAGAIAGVEVCGYPLEEPAATLDALAARFDHALLVTGDDASAVPDRRLSLAQLRSDGAVPDAGVDATVMILTTGTTGERRGAIHRWT